jgi:hypothetical protein
MPEELLSHVVGFIQAKQDHNAKALLKTLYEDILLVDQGKIYKGKEEVKDWIQGTNFQEKYFYEIIDAATSGDETRVSVLAKDRFESGPILLAFMFIIEQGLVRKVVIT